jgi:hypothetical protein
MAGLRLICGRDPKRLLTLSADGRIKDHRIRGHD